MMKKIYVTILLLLSVTLSYSQLFKGFLELGMSASQIDGDSWSGFKKVGIVSGLGVETNISQRLSIEISSRIIGKGSRYTEEDAQNGITNTAKISLLYVEVPILLNYNLRNRFWIEVGGSGAYLIKEKIEESGIVLNEDDASFYNRDFNLIAGLQYELKPRINLNIRIQYSLSSINRDINYYNRLITFSFFLKLKKKV